MTDTKNADFPVDDEGRTFHNGVGTEPATLPPYCLVVGSIQRACAIAEEHFSGGGELVSAGDRGYSCYVGSFNGVRMAVAVHGMGSGCAITLFNELYAAGARRFIRIGSCSSLHPDSKPGDIAILTSAIRFDGASDELVHPRVPAVASFLITGALLVQAENLRHSYLLGMGATAIGFYEGQGRPSVSGYQRPEMAARMELLRYLEVVALEMEAATLLTWAVVNKKVGVEAGVVLAVYANRSKPQGALSEKAGDKEAIETGLVTMSRLHHSHSHPLYVDDTP